MQKHTCSALLFVCLLLSSFLSLAKNVQYVSDELTIPMRTGTTFNHKILKFLKSGTALDILETTEDGKYARVALLEDETKTGWVETALLISEPSAREQLATLKKRYQGLKDKRAALKQSLAESRQQITDLQAVQAQLENRVRDLQATLARLRSSAAEPIRIADENQQLRQQLSAEKNRNEELLKENTFLGDQNIKQWFVIGAVVSIGSLLLGLLITRINWRKKDSWAGSF